MDVAIHPQGRLVRIVTCFEIRGGDKPNIAALITLADAFELEQLWIFFNVRLEKLGQFIVAIEFVEAWSGHGNVLRSISDFNVRLDSDFPNCAADSPLPILFFQSLTG